MFNANEFYKGLDALFAANDIAGAEKYLNDGLEAAVKRMDVGASLVIVNELMGFYRAAEKHEAAVQMADQGLELCKAMKLPYGPDYATTVLNAATAHRAAGDILEAIQLYDFAEQIYDGFLAPDDYRRASLYNNMSLAMQGLKRYEESEEKLLKALEIVTNAGIDDEKAATYVNLSANSFLGGDLLQSGTYLESAMTIYRNGHETDSHYAAALTLEGQLYEKSDEKEKAADSYLHALDITFGNYGKTATAVELYKAAVRCLEESGNLDKKNNIDSQWKNRLT